MRLSVLKEELILHQPARSKRAAPDPGSGRRRNFDIIDVKKIGRLVFLNSRESRKIIGQELPKETTVRKTPFRWIAKVNSVSTRRPDWLHSAHRAWCNENDVIERNQGLWLQQISILQNSMHREDYKVQNIIANQLTGFNEMMANSPTTRSKK